jgi:S-adenosylmethionine synthetase
MGRRINSDFIFTLACGIKDSYVNNPEEYFNKLVQIKQRVLKVIPEKSVISINQNDTPMKGGSTENYYLLVTGSSVECADPGQVGRGNRVTGMITPFRPQTMEATAGKNLTRHVGGFYNIWAQRIAKKVWDECGAGSQVILVSEIGKPVQDCHISVSSKKVVDKSIVNNVCTEIIDGYYEYLDELIKNGSEHYPFNYVA